MGEEALPSTDEKTDDDKNEDDSENNNVKSQPQSPIKDEVIRIEEEDADLSAMNNNGSNNLNTLNIQREVAMVSE